MARDAPSWPSCRAATTLHHRHGLAPSRYIHGVSRASSISQCRPKTLCGICFECSFLDSVPGHSIKTPCETQDCAFLLAFHGVPMPLKAGEPLVVVREKNLVGSY